MWRAVQSLTVFCLMALALLVAPAESADETIQFADDDAAMNAAIAEARATLDGFLALYESGQIDREGAALKVAVPTTEGLCCEHLWMASFSREGDVFRAVVANEPADVNYLQLGQPYQFTRENISDWNYNADGKIHGAYTLRVMLPRMDPRQAAEFRAVLAPLPE